MCGDNDIVLVFMQKVINKLIEVIPLFFDFLQKNPVIILLFVIFFLHFFAYPFHEEDEKRRIFLFKIKPIYPIKKFLEMFKLFGKGGE